MESLDLGSLGTRASLVLLGGQGQCFMDSVLGTVADAGTLSVGRMLLHPVDGGLASG